MAKSYEFEVIVEGQGRFPIDMLRRDRCFPKTETDSNVIERQGEERSVTVIRQSDQRFWVPTEGRWESFGWKIKSIQRKE